VQRLSQPFGTKIAIEDNVGVITLEPKDTSAGVR
jgi:hypothetical protein